MTEKTGLALFVAMVDFSIEIFWQDGNDIDYCRRRPLIDTDVGQCTNDSFNNDPHLEKGDYILCDPKDQILYEEFGMDSTAVTKFNLVCHDQYKVILFGVIYMYNRE